MSDAREALLELARDLVRLGLNRGSAGNASVRAPGGCWVTPTGLEPDAMTAADMVLVRPDGSFDGTMRPTSEWRLHVDLYAARPDVHAVVHTHAPYCTALACLGRDIPAFHYMVAIGGGGDIRCAPYATFGTAELSMQMLAAMRGRHACLLGHHGMIVVGADARAARKRAVELEELAEQYHHVLAINATPPLLSHEEMDRVLVAFASYGQPPQ